jgi:hypothetical protein
MNAANAVWVAAAQLHQQQPHVADFSVEEIVERAVRDGLTDVTRNTIQVHVNQHCVANRPPIPARLRMLQETGSQRRRLHRPGDPEHPKRREAADKEGSRITPRSEDLPPHLRSLVEWYLKEFAARANGTPASDPLLALKGAGKQVWGDAHPDDHVRELRAGWQ